MNISSNSGNNTNTSASSSSFDPLTFPRSIIVYVHTLKPLATITVGLADVLPEVIRDPREVMAAAVMCASSNVRGHFYKARMSITPDRSFVEITGTRVVDGMERPGARLFVPLLDIVGISKNLPISFGNEAVGNPLCGSRIAIKCQDRSVVVYATNSIDRDAWFLWLEGYVKKRDSANAGVAPAVDRALRSIEVTNTTPGRQTNGYSAASQFDELGPSNTPTTQASMHAAALESKRAPYTTMRLSNMSADTPGPMGTRPVDVEVGAVTSRAGLLFQVPSAAPPEGVEPTGRPAEISSLNPFMELLTSSSPAGYRGSRDEPPPLGTAFHKWQGGDDHSVAEAGEDDSDDEQRALDRGGFSPRDLAQFALPPLALDEMEVDASHLAWRYGPMTKLFRGATPEQLELMRQLQTLKTAGRWSELGQADPSDEQRADEHPSPRRAHGGAATETAPRADPVEEAKKAFAGAKSGNRVMTANERLNGNRPTRPTSSTEPTGEVPPHLADSSPMPWIEFPWNKSQEVHMMLMLKLAKLRLSIAESELSKPTSIPPQLTAAQVPKFWRDLYDGAVEHVANRRQTIRERLGVRKVGGDRTHERLADQNARARISTHLGSTI